MFIGYDIYIDHERSAEYGIMPVKRPDIPSPQRRVIETKIPGRDGTQYENTDYYEDIELDIEFNYMTFQDNWNHVWRKARKWFLNSIGKKLSFSDDISIFYRIKRVEISTNERSSLRIGKFHVTFTLDPYIYYVSGAKRMDYDACRYNHYDICLPTYFIAGEGMCELSVNGYKMKANVGQNLIIDTDRRISYRTDGTMQNTKVKGRYEELYLKEGQNEIMISQNFKLEIQPNWRCI